MLLIVFESLRPSCKQDNVVSCLWWKLQHVCGGRAELNNKWYAHGYQWPGFCKPVFRDERDCFLCNVNLWEKIVEVGGSLEKWQRLRERFRWVYCSVTSDPCLSLPLMVKAAKVPHFTFLKYTQTCTGKRIYTHWHGIHDLQPQIPDPLCILPADPSIPPFIRFCPNRWGHG